MTVASTRDGMPLSRTLALCGLVACVLASGCVRSVQPIPRAKHVDLQRFMGPWYVIASIPTFLEKNGIQAVVADEYISDLSHSTLSRVKLQVSRLNAERAWELLEPSGSRRFDARGSRS